MTIKYVREENAGEYIGVFPLELIDDFAREYCRGIVAEDEEREEVTAALFMQFRNIEDETPTEAEITWFYADSSKAGAEILRTLENNMEYGRLHRVYFELPDLSDNGREAFEVAGYTVERAESRDVYVRIDELAALKAAKGRPANYIKALSDINPRQFKAGIMTSVFCGRYGLLDDLPFLPMTRYDQEISSCVVTDDRVNGLLLVYEIKSGLFRVELLFAKQPDANINLLNMIRFSIKKASELRNGDEKVLLRRHNTAARQLVGKLFPDKSGAQVMKGEHICCE